MTIIMTLASSSVSYFSCASHAADTDIELFHYFEVVIKVSKKLSIHIFHQSINHQIKWHDLMRKHISFSFDATEQVQDSWQKSQLTLSVTSTLSCCILSSLNFSQDILSTYFFFVFCSLRSLYSMTYNNTTTGGCDLDCMHSTELHLAVRVAMGIIAVLSICSNGLLILLFLRNRVLLRSSYNVLILSLAVTDMTTGNSSIQQQEVQCCLVEIYRGL